MRTRCQAVSLPQHMYLVLQSPGHDEKLPGERFLPLEINHVALRKSDPESAKCRQDTRAMMPKESYRTMLQANCHACWLSLSLLF